MSRWNREGFTLLEAAAALLIVGAVVGGALAAAAADVRATRRAAAAMEASALAEDLLFRSQFLQWDSLTDYGARREGRFAAPLDRYTWRIRTAPVADVPGLVDAVATVRWSDGEFTATTRFGHASILP